MATMLILMTIIWMRCALSSSGLRSLPVFSGAGQTSAKGLAPKPALPSRMAELLEIVVTIHGCAGNSNFAGSFRVFASHPLTLHFNGSRQSPSW